MYGTSVVTVREKSEKAQTDNKVRSVISEKQIDNNKQIEKTETAEAVVDVLRVTGAFGIRGQVRARLFSDNIKSYKKIYDNSGNVFGFRVIRYVGGNSVIVSLDGIDDRDKALQLKGTTFHILRSDLEKTAENEYYVCDLVGKTVKIIENENIKCKITNVFNFGAGDLIEISYNSGTFLVPFTKDNFPENKLKHETDSDDEILMTLNAFTGYKD